MSLGFDAVCVLFSAIYSSSTLFGLPEPDAMMSVSEENRNKHPMAERLSTSQPEHTTQQ